MRAFLLFLSLLIPWSVASAQRPDVVATHAGTYEVSQGAAWLDLESSDFTATTGRALSADMCVAGVTVTNTHATQDLRLLLKANGGAGVVGILIPAGTTLSVSTYGLGATSMSIRGTGAATTGVIVGMFISGGC